MKNVFVLAVFIFSVSIDLYSQSFPAFDQIQEEDIRKAVYRLTADSLQGRDAGLPGGIEAGQFILNQLEKYKLNSLFSKQKETNQHSFIQKFEIIGATPEQIELAISLQLENNEAVEMDSSDYFYFFNSPEQLSLNTNLVFSGYAIEAPEYRYNDFENLDIKDKVVLAFYGEPLENDSLVFFNGSHQTHYLMEHTKAQEVSERGGRALVLIPTPDNLEKYSRYLQRKQSRQANKTFILRENDEVPVIYISPEFYEKYFGKWVKAHFAGENNRIRELVSGDVQQIISWDSRSFKTQNIKLLIKYENAEIRECGNIVAQMSGKGETDEYILIGAHYDHEGILNGEILAGADDNASGAIANLAVARAFSSLKADELPERNVVFAFWDAEEKGTLGSRYFIKHSPIPLQKIRVAFNMDMIGRDASFNFMALRKPMVDEGAENKVMLFYSAQAPGLEHIAEEANAGIDLNLLFDPNVFFTSGSDHVNFHALGIPVVYYFTGFHTDYTSANDTPDKINFEKLTRISRHIAQFVYMLANSRELPSFNREILSAPEGDFTR